MSKQLVDFLHFQYPDLMPSGRHSDTRTTKGICLNCAFTVYFYFLLTSKQRHPSTQLYHFIDQIRNSFPLEPQNHKCMSRCHQGPCYPCAGQSVLSCSCGSTSLTVPCGREKAIKPPRCRKLCTAAPDCHHPQRTRSVLWSHLKI